MRLCIQTLGVISNIQAEPHKIAIGRSDSCILAMVCGSN